MTFTSWHFSTLDPYGTHKGWKPWTSWRIFGATQGIHYGLANPSRFQRDKDSLAALARKCTVAIGQDCDEVENEIDRRVAALFGVELRDFMLTKGH